MPIVPVEQPRTLPPALVARLRDGLPELADEVVTAIAAEVPSYARPLESALGQGVRRGVRTALTGFLGLFRGADGTQAREVRAASAALGRGEMRAGRSLDALLSAYRVGARVAWQRIGQTAAGFVPPHGSGLQPSDLVWLGEQVFAYIDWLSSASIEGFAREQSMRAGERDQRRAALAALLVAQPPADAEVVERACAAAEWTAPQSLAVLAVPAVEEADEVAWRLRSEPGVLVTEAARRTDSSPFTRDEPPRNGAPWLAVLPDPNRPGLLRWLARLLAGTPAALGPSVGWPAAARSAAQARALLALVQRGVVPAASPAMVEDHLVELLLHTDDDVGRELVARRLAPLVALPAAAAERLAATLRSWLAHAGSRAAVADELHVHPQTVRYRMSRLRELFGDALDDPQARFELAVAVRLARFAPSLSEGS